jgi:hypothetical protein
VIDAGARELGSVTEQEPASSAADAGGSARPMAAED